MKLFSSRRAADKGEKKPRWRRVLAIVLAIIVLIAIGGYIALSTWIRPPEQITYTPKPTATASVAATDEPEEAETPEPTEEVLDTGYSNPNRYTFLVVGKEPTGDNTDTILVGTLDIKEKWLHIVSIPRDTLVNVPWSTKKINSLYGVSTENYTGWGYEDGIDGLLRGVGEIMGYEPAYWAVVDIEAFEKLVDAIGGVTFDIPYNMNKSELDIHFTAGEQWLSGADALKVMRYRDYPMGDIDRISVQQSFLKTLASEILTLGNVPNYGEALKIYDQYVYTNLASGNVAWFLTQFMSLDKDSITFQTMPGDYSLMINGLSYVGVNVDEWLEIVNNDLSPLNTEITTDDVGIVSYYNGYYSITSGSLEW
jgi:LCP family protein required for cell wall assembly